MLTLNYRRELQIGRRVIWQKDVVLKMRVLLVNFIPEVLNTGSNEKCKYNKNNFFKSIRILGS